MGPLFFVQGAKRGERCKDRIAIVRAAAPIELAVGDERVPRPVAVAPADHLGLLVEVAVHQHGLLRRALERRDFDQEERRAPVKAHHLELHSRHRVLAAPIRGELHRGVDIAVFPPGLVEVRRLGGNPDVVDERRYDRVVPELADLHSPKLYWPPLSALRAPALRRSLQLVRYLPYEVRAPVY